MSYGHGDEAPLTGDEAHPSTSYGDLTGPATSNGDGTDPLTSNGDGSDPPNVGDRTGAFNTDWHDARATFYGDINGDETQRKFAY